MIVKYSNIAEAKIAIMEIGGEFSNHQYEAYHVKADKGVGKQFYYRYDSDPEDNQNTNLTFNLFKLKSNEDENCAEFGGS